MEQEYSFLNLTVRRGTTLNTYLPTVCHKLIFLFLFFDFRDKTRPVLCQLPKFKHNLLKVTLQPNKKPQKLYREPKANARSISTFEILIFKTFLETKTDRSGLKVTTKWYLQFKLRQIHQHKLKDKQQMNLSFTAIL